MAPSATKLMLSVLVVLCLVRLNFATQLIVGDSSGWKPGVQYNLWAYGKTFRVGDELVFNYEKGTHTVAEINPLEGDKPQILDNSGHTLVTLKVVGYHQFVSTAPGDVKLGMSFTIYVQGANLP